MVIAGKGPWLVTFWIKEWPGSNKKRVEFDNVTWLTLEKDLNRALNKPKKKLVHGKYVPAEMVRFEIRAKK